MALGADLMQSASPPQPKKLRGQKVSLFCVFKTGSGAWAGVYMRFSGSARRENLLLFFQCRSPGGMRGAERQGGRIAVNI
jgi:hypothetical protein